MLTTIDAQRELQRRALEELAKRRKDPSFDEAVIRDLLRPYDPDCADDDKGLIPKQLEVMRSNARLMAVCCSRRAGKSELAARMLAIELIRGKHNHYTLFAARTLQRARQIIWALMTQINDRYALGWHCKEHVGEITTPKGARLILLGVDDTDAVEKARGSKYRLSFLDEASTYEVYLRTLVNDVIKPGTLDFTPMGRIIVAGTPGYTRSGFWWNLASGSVPGWKSFYWTMYDNPYMGDVESKLAEIRKDENLSEDDPTYKRECLGLWAVDEANLVFPYLETRNQVSDLPKPPHGMELLDWIREQWLVTIGIDVGTVDAFALVVLGSPPHSKDMYVLHAESEPMLTADQQAERIAIAREKFRPDRTVADMGGGGKALQLAFNQRYAHTAGGPLLAADKRGYLKQIQMMGSDMRVGRIKAHMPYAGTLVNEWAKLVWLDAEKKTKEHPAVPNHASSAARYAWFSHKSFFAEPGSQHGPQPEAVLEAQRAEERNKRALSDMRRAQRRR